VISAFNSLTLSPALSALLLRAHDAPKDRLTRFLDRFLGGFFSRFNRFFLRGSERYSGAVTRTLGRKRASMVIYVALLGATVLGFSKVPSGFVPIQDKGYLVSLVQLPVGATLDRTEAVVRKMRDLALGEPGFRNAVQEPGLSLNGFINSPASATVFLGEKTFEEMRESGTSGPQLAKTLQQKYAAIKDAFIAVFPPPPVQGLGKSGGFKLQIEDRGDAGYEALSETVKTVVDKARKAPELAGVYSTYNVTTPQLFADVDRTKAAQLGVDVDDIFKTMQIYLGSLYVNDFNKFGRTYQVIAQGDKDFRSKREDILGLKIRNVEGKMVPLGAVVSLRDASGPDSAARYNGYRSADINGGPAPGYSTGQAQAAITKILNESLTGDMTFEWTELTYQQILAGNTALIVFPICILLVFLVLTAQYESVFLPLAIILIVPMCLFSAIAGVWLTGGDNNLFTQIGFFVLIGLACKNAILIGEFARELEIQGKSTYAAAVEAAHLRLRPILMTSIAFIAGVLPLVLSHGAGAEMRHAMGVAVFFGMIGVTFFGLFLTPIFYVMARALEKRITRTEKVHHHVEA
jgi:multidrug efflux pump